MAQTHPVYQISKGAAQLQTQAEAQQPRGEPLAAVQQYQHRDADEGHQNQRRVVALKQAEYAARVEGVCDPEEALAGDGLVEQQELPDQVL